MTSLPQYNTWSVRVAGTQLFINTMLWKSTQVYALQCHISKVHPRTTHEGCMWGWVVNAMPWLLYSREGDAIPIVQEAEWTPGPVWMGAENLAHTGIRSLDCPAC